MTATERRSRWEQRICNADGAEVGQPKRSRTVLYLSDEARETLRLNRQLRAGTEVKGQRDSELIEELLKVHVGQRQAPTNHLQTQHDISDAMGVRWLQRKCMERHHEPPDDWSEAPSKSPLYRRAIVRAVLEEWSAGRTKKMDKRQALEVCLVSLQEDPNALRKLLQDLKPFIDPGTTAKLGEREIRTKVWDRIETFLRSMLGVRAM